MRSIYSNNFYVYLFDGLSKSEIYGPSFPSNAYQLPFPTTYLVIEYDMVVAMLFKQYYPVGKGFEKDQTKGGSADLSS